MAGPVGERAQRLAQLLVLLAARAQRGQALLVPLHPAPQLASGVIDPGGWVGLWLGLGLGLRLGLGRRQLGVQLLYLRAQGWAQLVAWLHRLPGPSRDQQGHPA